MVTKIAVVSIWAEDIPTTIHFYLDVIGLRLMPHHGKQPAFDLDGTYLVILKGRPIPAQDTKPSRFPIIAFSVDDLDKAIAKLNSHQVDLPWGIEENVNSRWVMFHDPAGNLIELVEFTHPSVHYP